MSIRDLTLTEIQRAEALAGEAEVAFVMDEEAFRAFYDRTSRGLCAYLARVTGDRALADDLMQDAYYRFLRADAPYESESHRRHSLFRIATNLARDAHRRQRVRRLTSLGDTDVPSTGSRRRAGRAPDRSLARDAVAQVARARHAVARLRRGLVAPRNRPADGTLDRQREAAAVPRAASSGRDPHGAARSVGLPGRPDSDRARVRARSRRADGDLDPPVARSRAGGSRRARGRLCHCADVLAVASAFEDDPSRRRRCRVRPTRPSSGSARRCARASKPSGSPRGPLPWLRRLGSRPGSA